MEIEREDCHGDEEDRIKELEILLEESRLARNKLAKRLMIMTWYIEGYCTEAWCKEALAVDLQVMKEKNDR